jgi:diketogulonate reductase-like aldo/keto reductase
MLTKELARTGVMLPEVGLGTWNYHAGAEPLRYGLESGALFIDTAEVYGTEPVVAKAIRGTRRAVFLATKVSARNFGAADLRKSAENSLRLLGTDVIDLYQLHEPNPMIPIEETMGAMAALVDAGKVRFIGVSNFSVAQLEQARKALGKYPVVSNQVRYSLIDRTIEGGLLQYCQTAGITVIAYSPLARGMGRIADCDPTGILARIARETGKTEAQIAINWCLCQDGVIAIPKGNSIEHVLENCASSGWYLTPEQLRLLNDQIRYRRRTWLDAFVRRHMPRSVHGIALRTARMVPAAIRRRVF